MLRFVSVRGGLHAFSSRENAHTSIELYDFEGKKIKMLLDKNLQAGKHEVQWSRAQLSAGIYFLKVKMNEETSAVKIIIE